MTMKEILPVHTATGRPAHQRRGGFTLVEMMVAAALLLLVTAGLLQAYIQYSHSMKRNRLLAELNSTLRMATLFLFRDISMAGYGLDISDVELNSWIDWTDALTTNPTITQGAGSNADRITMAAAYNRVGSLSAPAAVGDTTLSTSQGTASELNLTNKKLIYIGRSELARVTAISSNQITISTSPSANAGLEYAYPANAPIELVKVYTYMIYPSNPSYLQREDYTAGTLSSWFSDIITDSVEDMQVVRDGDRLEISLRGRSLDTDHWHTDPTFGDNYIRTTVTNVVYMRNTPGG